MKRISMLKYNLSLIWDNIFIITKKCKTSYLNSFRINYFRK